jgi:hypothetical protein
MHRCGSFRNADHTQIVYLDFEGRSDGRSMKNVISKIKPQQMVCVCVCVCMCVHVCVCVRVRVRACVCVRLRFLKLFCFLFITARFSYDQPTCLTLTHRRS